MLRSPDYENGSLENIVMNELVLDGIEMFVSADRRSGQLDNITDDGPVKGKDISNFNDGINNWVVDVLLGTMTDVCKADLELVYKNDTAKKDFLMRKLISLIKKVKSTEYYTPDLMEEYVLFLIASWVAADEYDEIWKFKSANKNKLLKKLKQYLCVEHAGDDDDSDQDYWNDRYECWKKALTNYGKMYAIDNNEELGLLVWDYDYSFIAERGLFNSVELFLHPAMTYGKECIREIFTSAGLNVPAIVEAIITYTEVNSEQIMANYTKSVKNMFTYGSRLAEEKI